MIDVTTAILRGHDRHAAVDEIRASLADARIPLSLCDGLVRYFLDGIRPGKFLESVLKNDLREAVLRFSGDHHSDIKQLILWLSNAVPGPSWGDPQSVELWIINKSPAKQGEE